MIGSAGGMRLPTHREYGPQLNSLEGVGAMRRGPFQASKGRGDVIDMKRDAARLIQERRRSRRTNHRRRPGAQCGRARTGSGKDDKSTGGNRRDISRRTDTIDESVARDDIERSNFKRTHRPCRTIFRCRHGIPLCRLQAFAHVSLSSGPGRAFFLPFHPFRHRTAMDLTM